MRQEIGEGRNKNRRRWDEHRKGWEKMGIQGFLSSGDDRLDRRFLFTAEIDQMTSVLRRTLLLDRSRRENDAEHSWHIAVMAMLFSEYATEPVDIGRVVQMCVVHDLVEIYAGDTFAYDAVGNADKEAREKKAADKLFAMLPKEQGRMIRSMWEEFDAMETADAKYAACMDRLQPFYHGRAHLGGERHEPRCGGKTDGGHQRVYAAGVCLGCG